ncbi:MAG TPA: TlpA disulfide reductase family protein [Bacteroidia bacterium]|nr:TlpA disulfide reductase family protein [Bacteroidia bacterium]
MKKTFIAIVIVAICSMAFKFDGGKIPVVIIKNLDGSKVSTSTFTNNGKPIIISFWATWCKPSKKELDNILDDYVDWQKETGVKIIAISIDDARTLSKVITDAKTKGWPYEVYLDDNQDFKRAMNVNVCPHIFIIDGKGEIVWQHNSYAEGDEIQLYENVKHLIKGEKLEH